MGLLTEPTIEELLDGPAAVLRMVHAADDQNAKLRQHAAARALFRAMADRIGLVLGTWEVRTTEDGGSTWLMVNGEQAALLRTLPCNGSPLGHAATIPGMVALLVLMRWGGRASLPDPALTVGALLDWARTSARHRGLHGTCCREREERWSQTT